MARIFSRYGGHFVLLIAMMALFITGRDQIALALQSEAEVEPAVNSAESTAPTSTPDAIDADAAFVDSEIPNFDTSGIPVYTDTDLSPALNPFTYQGKTPEHDFRTYVVERGDTPGSIASSFGIETETLLGGNEFLGKESSLLQVGVELIILPVDGVLHDVTVGETLEGLADFYGVPVDDIIGYAPNNLEFPYRLFPETQLVIPGAVRELFVWTPPQLPNSTYNSQFYDAQNPPYVVGTGTFSWPVNARFLTQVYWAGHRAIDVGLPEGSLVVASDTGTVTYAGWNVYGYGNVVVVNHGNGYETLYAHLSGFNVVAGQVVNKGQLVGYSGNTGNSSGPHIHFEIRIYGALDDPLWYLP